MDATPVSFGPPRAERADAVRNREHLLAVARQMLAEHGVKPLTMDALAERAELGKGTVFRRFGSRAGIFAALLDDADRRFQEQVLAGPPPLGPGADAFERLSAYGFARIGFIFEHHAIERAALDRSKSMLIAGGGMSTIHIRMLLGQARREGRLRIADIDTLAMQLAAALEGPPLLYYDTGDQAQASARQAAFADGWAQLVERLLSG